MKGFPTKGIQVDKEISNYIGNECHKTAKKRYTFDEQVENIFKKVKATAIRHKYNFKDEKYDLDAKVSEFLSGREMRLLKDIARRN